MPLFTTATEMWLHSATPLTTKSRTKNIDTSSRIFYGCRMWINVFISNYMVIYIRCMRRMTVFYSFVRIASDYVVFNRIDNFFNRACASTHKPLHETISFQGYFFNSLCANESTCL